MFTPEERGEVLLALRIRRQTAKRKIAQLQRKFGAAARLENHEAHIRRIEAAMSKVRKMIEPA